MAKKRARYSYDLLPSIPKVMTDSSKSEEKTAGFAMKFQSRPLCILVGPEKTPYHLHLETLNGRCAYFRGRADFQAKGGLDDQDTISFEEISCEVFDLFVEYIYTSTYNTPADLSMRRTCELHVRLYTFADFLMMSDLKEEALNKTKTLLNDNTWKAQIYLTSQNIIQLLQIVYDHTTGGFTLMDLGEKDDGLSNDQDETSNDQDETSNDQDETSNDKPTSSASAVPAIEEVEITVKAQLDPMRLLFAWYAASQIETLRNDENFYAMISDHRDIARDIILYLQPAGSL